MTNNLLVQRTRKTTQAGTLTSLVHIDKHLGRVGGAGKILCDPASLVAARG